MLTVVIPLLLVGVAFTVAACFEQKIPTRLRIYRFHAIVYPGVMILGLVMAYFMKLWRALGWWVDDATLYLELLFGISGVVLCVVLTPVVWWLERRPDQTTAHRIGRMTVSALTFVPYFLIAGILLFYRE